MNEVDDIKQRLDIVEVISAYVPLKQAGSNYKGLSPFKTEKTPSFMVSSEKNIWHDFSTGQGGDIFSFIMQVEGIEFREALEMLAQRAGVELKPRGQGGEYKKASKTPLYNALEEAMKYYHLTLSKNAKALEYFTKKRKLSKDTIKRFRLGYSPDSWNALSDHLLAKGFSQDQLLEAGLVRQKEGKSTIYDTFRDRVMFPVFDVQNRVVGFSARVLSDSVDMAKYINTPDSPVYHKGAVLYGLSQAKEAIRAQGDVILVEGNVDVLAVSAAGFENVVAASGTALTLEQLKILSRMTKTIKLCLDQDSAGEEATLRSLELASQLDIKLMVVDLGKAKDPDELIAQDANLWKEALASAKYAPDYIFSTGLTRFDASSATGKKDLTNFVLPCISRLQDDIEISHYIKKLAQFVDVDEELLYKKLNTKSMQNNNAAVKEPEVVSVDTKESKKRKLTRAEKIEQNLLELMLISPPALAVLADIDPASLSDLHRPIFEAFVAKPSSTIDEFAKHLPKHAQYVKILSLRGDHVYSALSEHDARLEAFTLLHRLQHLALAKTKKQLSAQIAQAESQNDTNKAKQLLKAYQKLLNEE